MLITKTVEIAINSRNQKYLENLGYNIPRIKDDHYRNRIPRGTKILVKVQDLQEGGTTPIQCLCDYCLEEGEETIVIKKYCKYIDENKNGIIHKDCCKKCYPKKVKESNLLLYGVENVLKIEEVKEKIKQTNLKQYDFEYASQNSDIKKKIKQTNIEKYGVESYTQTDECKEKILTTNIERYGIGSYTQTDECIDKIKQTNKEKYGVTSYTQTSEYIEKMKITNLKKYGTEWQSQNSDVREKIKSVCIEKYGVENVFQIESIKDTFRGKNHYNWQGGLTYLNHHLRKFISQWKKDSMKDCNYKCVITGERFSEIHHLYGFDLILQELIKELKLENVDFSKTRIEDLPDEEIKLIEDKWIELHNKYPLGVCLKKEIHDLFHFTYGYGKNTPEQFEDFAKRYKSGEFIKKNNKNITTKAS